MAKRTFFSFHYQDVIDFRANVVRQHKTTKDNHAGYFDASIWEKAKRTSPLALKRLINSELAGTSVTCVLIGSETYQRPWVKYEIFRSIYKCNKLIGIHINKIACKNGKTKTQGNNPFDFLGVKFNADGSRYAFVEKKGSTWYYWEEIDSTRFFANDYFDRNYAKRNAGKVNPLSNFFSTYDWVDHDGYNKFDKWLE
jgi:hypothetical protein